MAEDIEAVRGFVRAVLPDRVLTALAGYERFTAEDPPADAKGFAAWQAAAKAAVAHVEGLVKLVRWAEGKDDAVPEGEDGVANLLAQARAAVGRWEGGEEGEGDGDGDGEGSP